MASISNNTNKGNGNGRSKSAQGKLDLASQAGGPVKPVEFHEIFGENYGIYGLHVVQERALPDARDGLKPVQRRILYTLWEGRYLSSGPHRKSAEIVGKVLGDRHPHGDTSVYDAMSRMAQPFSLRYPMIDGQGNWGASDGSPAAAYRYTEARLTPLAEALLSDDLKKETVPLLVTYKEDPRVLEPLYLPGHIPPCVNSIDGIAVGISTAVPPHNLGEALRVSIAMLDGGVLDGKGFTTEQLMAYIPGPDFPEGGRVMIAAGGVREYLEGGKGRFTVRAEIGLEQLTPSRKALVISALPPIGRDKVISSIIDAINDRKPGTEGLIPEPPLDETNEIRTRIVLELKRDANPTQVMESLYRHTMLQIAVSAQLYFLFASKVQTAASHPRQVGLVELLSYWLHHQLDVVERRLTYELAQYRTRLSTVEALIIGATHAQEVVKIFQLAEGKAAAKATIRAKYKLSEEQAEVIASMSLSQVTKPDAGKYQAERLELLSKIGYHEELLASRPKRIALLKSELKETEKKFGDARRTVIDKGDLTSVTLAGNAATSGGAGALLASQAKREPLAVTLYADSTIKATPLDQFGPKSKTVRSDEGVVSLAAVGPTDFVLVATSTGRVFNLPLDNLTIATRAGKGESLVRHLKLERDERVVNLLAVNGAAFASANDEAAANDSREPLYMIEFSALGKVKKSPITDYKTATTTGLGSLKLASSDTGKPDEVVTALLSNGRGEYLVTTDSGQTLRFSDEKLSAQGRVGQGQAAIALDGSARIVNACFYAGDNNLTMLKTEPHLVILTEEGLLKKTALSEYPLKGRATGGIATTLLTPEEKIAATWLSTDGKPENLVAASRSGNAVVNFSLIPALPRARKGQPLSQLITGVPSTNNGPSRLLSLSLAIS